ncbi:hypothetical protein M2271_001853 [Streptomyces sp. LBL]|nr:hypothetical protein [Streptomyces sp. LBL]
MELLASVLDILELLCRSFRSSRALWGMVCHFCRDADADTETDGGGSH